MALMIRVTAGPHAGQEYLIDRRQTFMVGRSSRVHFPMTGDLMLSREHFRIENQPPQCHLMDLGSTNGTKVNGHRVERVLLREGDVITAGDSSFVVHFFESSSNSVVVATCAGCGRRIHIEDGAELGAPELASADQMGAGVWLCTDCRNRRLRFPLTHPDYLIEKWIGDGGMGEVYLARAALEEPAGRHQDDECQLHDRRQGERLFPPRDRGLEGPLDARRAGPSGNRRLLRDL